MTLTNKELSIFLEEKYHQYSNPGLIADDPVSIPHTFTKKEDIEISGFLTATISWGQRKSIIKNAFRLMSFMGNEPYNFIMNASERDYEAVNSFVHRTFNDTDCKFFLVALSNIYHNHGGLEKVFESGYYPHNSVADGIRKLREVFFEPEHPPRVTRHFSDINKKAAAKRINMYLRWMVRRDNRGSDFGIWKNISMADLYLPLDVHAGNTARKLGLLTRKQNDWLAVVELTHRLREINPADPVRYDYALFGLGVYEKF